MKDFWQNLWIKIWRMWRKQFFLNHLYMILWIIVFSFLFWWAIFLICWDGNDSFGCKIIERLVEDGWLVFIMFFLYLLSNLFLAKRFQDCWICGVWAFILWLLFPTIVLIILSQLISYNKIDFIYSSTLFFSILLYIYPIVLIIMCFEKWDAGPNKYGNPV